MLENQRVGGPGKKNLPSSRLIEAKAGEREGIVREEMGTLGVIKGVLNDSRVSIDFITVDSVCSD